jgi:RNA polymerase-binding transcription factor DksA
VEVVEMPGGKPIKPFKSPRQEAYLWKFHPDVARHKFEGTGKHAPGWKKHLKEKVLPKAKKAKDKKRKADDDMEKVTYTQLVNEAIQAMNEGDHDIATELFRAALPLRETREITAGDAGACTSCGKPIAKKIVYGCKKCGTKEAASICESCFSKQAKVCSACGGPMTVIKANASDPDAREISAERPPSD